MWDVIGLMWYVMRYVIYWVNHVACDVLCQINYVLCDVAGLFYSFGLSRQENANSAFYGLTV